MIRNLIWFTLLMLYLTNIWGLIGGLTIYEMFKSRPTLIRT